jgi:hypothetical protein
MDIYSLISFILAGLAIILIYRKKYSDIGYILLGIVFIINGFSYINNEKNLAGFTLLIAGFIIGCAVTRMRFNKEE